MAGRKGRSGRKKVPSTIIREMLDRDSENVPLYFQALSHRALVEVPVVCPHCNRGFNISGGGDREAAIYLIDRHLGKPKASAEIDLSGGESLGIGMIEQLRQLMIDTQKEVEARHYALQEQGERPQLAQGKKK